MAPLRAVIFDFDGVLLESEPLKLEAAARLFADEPDYLPDILQYWRENRSLPRSLKFEHIYAAILQRPLSHSFKVELGRRFGAEIAAAYRTCPRVPGAVELLDDIHGRYLLFVASTTPEEELVPVVHVQGLARYFNGVFGSPATKTVICHGIMTHWDLDPSEVLMVGDSLSDLEAAQDAGIGFVGRHGRGESTFSGKGVKVVGDLFGLASLFKALD